MQNLAKGSAIATALLSGTGIYLYPKYKDVIFKPAKQPVNHYDTCVIGGGIVGLSIARDLATRGQKVILFEKNKSFASECSGASSGLSTVTNYECDKNSLEFKLLKRSLQLQEVLYEKFGLSNQKGHHLIDCGRILLPSDNDKNIKNEKAELEKLIHNCQRVSDATPSAGKTKMLDKSEIMNLEPSLNPLKISKSGGGEIATEGIVEPFLLATAHNYSALLHGAELQNNSKVQSVYRTRDPEDESMKWVVLIEDPTHQETLGIQKAISTNVINCTGLHSMKTEKIVPGKDHPNPKKFKIFPRTGEFVMFDPKFLDQDSGNQNHNQLNSILQPFRQEKLHHLGDQLRIYQNTFGNLVVGPIFQDPGITEKIDYKNDVQAIAKLQNLLKAHLPKLTDCQFIGSYSCIWPVVTDQKDYIIEKKDNNWTTVANIRSLGLNNSTAIGEYVADLVTDTKKNNNENSESVADSFNKMKTSPELPKINEIIKNYCKNGDGSVDLYGQNWKVNHQGTRISLDQACLKLK